MRKDLKPIQLTTLFCGIACIVATSWAAPQFQWSHHLTQYKDQWGVVDLLPQNWTTTPLN